jgi:DNA-binding CsgD family transcriptional regulator
MIKKTRSRLGITKPVQVKKINDAGKDLEYILLHLPFPLLILDTQGWAVMVNQSFLNLFAMRSADKVIRKFNILKHPVSKAMAMSEHFKKALRGEMVIIPELRISAAQMWKKFGGEGVGDMIFEFTMIPIFDETGKVWRVVTTRKDITEMLAARSALRDKERKLSEQNILLKDKNTALREVLSQLADEKRMIGERIRSNVDRFILPVLAKLKHGVKEEHQKYIELMEANLREILSSFGKEMSAKLHALTYKEIELCNMLKNGITSKEAARLLNISVRTVETHRNRIRKKMGISRSDVNLVTYLQQV